MEFTPDEWDGGKSLARSEWLKKEHEVQLRQIEPNKFDDWWDLAKAKTKKNVLKAKDRLMADVLRADRAKAV